jgi:hypothetical protein
LECAKPGAAQIYPVVLFGDIKMELLMAKESTNVNNENKQFVLPWQI